MAQKIIPNIWFDKNAEEAVGFYTALFPQSDTGRIMYYDKASAEVSGQPEGSVLTVDFALAGQRFIAINGGTYFKPNPAVSFFYYGESEEEIDRVYKSLVEGGSVLMELKKYDFAEKYAWVSDRYGISWQIAYMKNHTEEKIVPSIMFIHDNYLKAKEAMQFYISVFKDGSIEFEYPYPEGSNEKEGALAHAAFRLFGQKFIAMDSSYQHEFQITGAISFLVNCENQQEIDEYWNKLSSDPQSEQCGWLKDKYGVTWQIVPQILDDMIADSDKEKGARVMKAMLGMKKIDIEGLEKAARGE